MSTDCGHAGEGEPVSVHPKLRGLEQRQTLSDRLATHVRFRASISIKNEVTTRHGTLVSDRTMRRFDDKVSEAGAVDTIGAIGSSACARL